MTSLPGSSEQKGSRQEPLRRERPPSATVALHYVHTCRDDEEQQQGDRSAPKEWSIRDGINTKGGGDISKRNTWIKIDSVHRGFSNASYLP